MPQTSTLTWTKCQRDASEILAEGFFALRSEPHFAHRDGLPRSPGIYLFFSDGVPQYVGEAKDLRARAKQQFTVKTSTFYKTYCKRTTQPREIDAFHVQALEVGLGRKELEEFVVVNAATPLNNFHRAKWAFASSANTSESWQAVQTQVNALLCAGETELFVQPRVPWSKASAPTTPGIYLVQAEGYDAPLYIGEGSSLLERLKAHRTTTYFSALRRHIGTELLGFTLQTLKGKKRYFRVEEDEQVDRFLTTCHVTYLPVTLGRLELEERLISKYQPILNRKGNLNLVTHGF